MWIMENRRELLIGAVLGILNGLFLVWRMRYYVRGELIPLPPIRWGFLV